MMTCNVCNTEINESGSHVKLAKGRQRFHRACDPELKGALAAAENLALRLSLAEAEYARCRNLLQEERSSLRATISRLEEKVREVEALAESRRVQLAIAKQAPAPAPVQPMNGAPMPTPAAKPDRFALIEME